MLRVIRIKPRARARAAKARRICYDCRMDVSASLQSNRGAIIAAAGRYHAANPRVFGSVLHGTANARSDLDVLVDALPGATLFDLGGLQAELEELLGVPVDLLTPADLRPKWRARILAEAQPV